MPRQPLVLIGAALVALASLVAVACSSEDEALTAEEAAAIATAGLLTEGNRPPTPIARAIAPPSPAPTISTSARSDPVARADAQALLASLLFVDDLPTARWRGPDMALVVADDLEDPRAAALLDEMSGTLEGCGVAAIPRPRVGASMTFETGDGLESATYVQVNLTWLASPDDGATIMSYYEVEPQTYADCMADLARDVLLESLRVDAADAELRVESSGQHLELDQQGMIGGEYTLTVTTVFLPPIRQTLRQVAWQDGARVTTVGIQHVGDPTIDIDVVDLAVLVHERLAVASATP